MKIKPRELKEKNGGGEEEEKTPEWLRIDWKLDKPTQICNLLKTQKMEMNLFSKYWKQTNIKSCWREIRSSPQSACTPGPQCLQELWTRLLENDRTRPLFGRAYGFLDYPKHVRPPQVYHSHELTCTLDAYKNHKPTNSDMLSNSKTTQSWENKYFLAN